MYANLDMDDEVLIKEEKQIAVGNGGWMKLKMTRMTLFFIAFYGRVFMSGWKAALKRENILASSLPM